MLGYWTGSNKSLSKGYISASVAILKSSLHMLLKMLISDFLTPQNITKMGQRHH